MICALDISLLLQQRRTADELVVAEEGSNTSEALRLNYYQRVNIL